MLARLAELTGESANLAVLTQGRAEYVAQAAGRHAMRIFTEVGNRVALHCTGVGKALLASVPAAQTRRLIEAGALTARTATTITDPAAFAVMRSYSPYDNVEAKPYPPVLALGGLTDPRVTYWEPLKWVAKIRALTTRGGPILNFDVLVRSA